MRGEGRTSHANCAAHVHACMHACMHACAHERSGGARENAAVNMNADIEMNPNLETAAGVVREFWRLMGTNDFHAVAAVLADDFVLEWPQSNERIRGARNFALLNGEYPAHGPWTFTIGRVIGDACEAVSDVSVTDGVQRAGDFVLHRGEPEDRAHRRVLARAVCRALRSLASRRTDRMSERMECGAADRVGARSHCMRPCWRAQRIQPAR